MKKILFVILLFLTIFALKSFVFGNQTYAATSAIVGVELDNSAGTIPITVHIDFFQNGSLFSHRDRQVAIGDVEWVYSDLDEPDAPPYSVNWWTDCTDPPVQATFQGTWGSDIGPSVAAYEVTDQDVHCYGPNATPAINNTSCATVGWTLTAIGGDGLNIDHFEVFRSQNSSQVGPGDPTIPPVASVGSSARSYNFGSVATGTHYVRIRAVSPQSVGSWSSVGNFTCGATVSPANGLNANTSCSGSGSGNIVNASFTWNRSTPTPSDEQWLDFSVFNNGFASGYQARNVGTGASSYGEGGFAQNITYYWRINNRYGSNWFSSATGSFATPRCDVGVPSPTPSAGAPSPTPSSCPAGCSNPSNISDNWSNANAFASATDGTNTRTLNCGGHATSCSFGFLSFCGGCGVFWRVNVNTGSGWQIASGGGSAAGDGSFSFSFSWPNPRYTYAYCTVPGISTSSCFAAGAGPQTVVTTNNSDYSFTPLPNTYYHREACVPNCSSGTSVFNTTSQSGACVCPTPSPTPTPSPVSTITLSGFSDCIDGVNPIVHLTWSSNTGSASYTVQHFVAAWTNVGSSSGLSWNSSPGAYASGAGNISFRVIGGATISNTAVVTIATCSPPPADPSDLTVSSSCDASGNPIVNFQWRDNANNEIGFWLDVNGAAWTGPSAPSPWAVKEVLRSAAETTATNVIVGPVQWSSTSQMSSGTPLTPAKSTTYYWRVKAYGYDRQSNHVYPEETLIPPGISFTTPSCQFDLAAEFGSGNQQTFEVDATANVAVRVYNTTSGTVVSPNFNGLSEWGIGIWPKSAAPIPDCDTLGSEARVEPPNANERADFGSLVPGASTSAGSFQIINFSFSVGSTPGVYTAFIYVNPQCYQNAQSDVNWSNNILYFTYAVQPKSWFQTIGGDVGARANPGPGTIDISYDPPPGNQSDYALVAYNTGNAKGQWELNGYDKPLFPPNNGSVYDYLATRFRNKATYSQCAINDANLLAVPAGTDYVQCTGAASAGGNITAANRNFIIFVDGDLTVNSSLIIPTSTTVTFVVQGNIIVNTPAVFLHGIYITRGSFSDCTTNCNPSGRLDIYGGVYAGSLNLARVLSTGPLTNLNDFAASVRITYQPRYLVAISRLLGSPAVSWREVEP